MKYKLDLKTRLFFLKMEMNSCSAFELSNCWPQINNSVASAFTANWTSSWICYSLTVH